MDIWMHFLCLTRLLLRYDISRHQLRCSRDVVLVTEHVVCTGLRLSAKWMLPLQGVLQRAGRQLHLQRCGSSGAGGLPGPQPKKRSAESALKP